MTTGGYDINIFRFYHLCYVYCCMYLNFVFYLCLISSPPYPDRNYKNASQSTIETYTKKAREDSQRYNILVTEQSKIKQDITSLWLRKRYDLDIEYRQLSRVELEKMNLCEKFPTIEEAELANLCQS